MHRADRKGTWKGFGFPLAAILIGLLPLVGFEIGLRVAGIGEPAEAVYPQVGFQAVRPLFELNEETEQFEIAATRQVYFYPDAFDAKKGDREFRIFCLGGSTVQGRPYSIETSFTTWLELGLTAADPSRDWQVVNCGGVSYASYRLVPILRETLSYQADLIIIYSGHNEFLEARTFGGVNQIALTPLTKWCIKFRTYNLLREAWVGESPLEQPRAREILATEVDALLDYQGGLADYHRDDASQHDTVNNYQQNLREMIELGKKAGVPVVCLNPVSNLRDCPPFKVEGAADLSPQEQVLFEQFWSEAKSASDPRRRLELLDQALEIDERHAAACFLRGRSYLDLNRLVEARRDLLQARDEDVCQLRMIGPLHDALRNVCSATRTPLLDVREMFEQRTASGIPGNEMLLDHIHPSITGHQLIANKIIEHLVQLGSVSPDESWESRRQELFRRHLGTLDAVYYAKGQQRLEGLIRWTEGRVIKLREDAATGGDDRRRRTQEQFNEP